MISLATGAVGSAVAQRVGSELGWDVLDREIIDIMADKYGVPRDYLEYAENTTWTEGRDIGQATYLRQLSEILLLATQRGNVVIAGHGAEFLLPNETNFSVLLTQSFDDRVQNTRFPRHGSLETAKKAGRDSKRATSGMCQP